jgi:hypothetical protein
LTWVFNILILLTSYYYNGYKDFWKFIFKLFDKNYEKNFLLSKLFIFFSSRGIIKWEVYFKIIMCRQISFNYDFFNCLFANKVENEKTKNIRKIIYEKNIEDLKNKNFIKINSSECKRRHILGPRLIKDYSFINYVYYCYYSPLYLGFKFFNFLNFIFFKFF